MKRTSKRRLHVSKQTMRSLTLAQLDQVDGGSARVPDASASDNTGKGLTRYCPTQH
jgi:hypothetical protein